VNQKGKMAVMTQSSDSGVSWNTDVLVICKRWSTGALYFPSCSCTCSSSCFFEKSWT